jgi:hypothetical protein
MVTDAQKMLLINLGSYAYHFLQQRGFFAGVIKARESKKRLHSYSQEVKKVL